MELTSKKLEFNEAIATKYSSLLKYAVNHAHDFDLGQDAFHSALCLAWEKLDGWKGTGNIESWLRIIILNVIRGEWNKKYGYGQKRVWISFDAPLPGSNNLTFDCPDETVPNMVEAINTQQQWAMIRRALPKLTPTYQKTLHRVVQEIPSLMTNNCRLKKHRAIQAMRQELKLI